MKLSCFITITDPKKRGDIFDECFASAKELCDEVVVIDGEKTWKQEFEWPTIGEHFQKGYQQATGDWVIHLDTDFIFHQKDFGKIRQAIRDYEHSPAISFYKWQFVLPDRYNLKSRLLLAVNKKAFGDRITFSGGGDLCQPQLDGKDLSLDEMPQAGVPFYNYEKLIKKPPQVADDAGRMDRAYYRTYKGYMYGNDGSDLAAFNGWIDMMKGRFNRPSEHIPLEAHPKYIQKTIKKLKPNQWGYSGFGLLERNDYVKSLVRS